ncbi:MAG: molecular chaperone HscC [Planctomycetaceae bacterium]|nr:molecular chaperone HscC [Planctomycetaceae bacterium]
MTDKVVVGIDLGTTNSLCAVFRDGKPELIPNAHGSVLTPSVVGILESGDVIVGIPAKELRITQPDRCASTFKRWMGTDRHIEVAGRRFSAPELSSLVLKSLKHDAEAFLGQPVGDAVITVPAYFNDHQRKATRLAGELAGLKVRRIINEPTAAALTYGFHDRQSDRRLVVIDLGGGTFDVTLMEIFEGTLEIIATAGESMLGGEDFTDRLVSIVLQQLGLQLETAELRQPLMVSRLRQQCEQAKRQFGTDSETVVRIPDEKGNLFESGKRVRVTRSSFAKISAPLMQRLQAPVGRVLRDAELNVDQIDEVILVGGATRMPLISDFVQEYLNKQPLCQHNPDEVVALGAAVQAALIEDHAAVDDMVMTDVCPFTLGVETVRELGGRYVEGSRYPVGHRNTTIPVSREEVFQTVAPNQSEVLLKVFQGEARRVKDNVQLGELRVTGIPPGPAGQEVFVRFTYDLNGILEVEAMVGNGGTKQRCVIASHAAGLSEAEISEAVEKLQQLKFYPREDADSQRLLLFAERLVGEVSPAQRQQLEMAVHVYEEALHVADRVEFEKARTMLLMVFSALGVDYDDRKEQA